MAVSYKKLFKILIDRDMKKKEFRDFVGISYSTMSKLEKGENTTVEVLEKIWRARVFRSKLAAQSSHLIGIHVFRFGHSLTSS